MTGPYATAAHTYWQAGWRGILPLPANAKKLPPKGFTGQDGADPSYADIQTWLDGREADGNIALRLPRHLIGLDVDNYGDKHGADVLGKREADWGTLPATWRTTSRDDGVSGIRLYAVPEGLAWPGELGPATELIQHRHRYTVVWPSIHPEGRTYRWISPDGVTSTVVPDPDGLPLLPDRWVAELTGGELAAPTQRNAYSNAQTAQWLALRPGAALEPCQRMRAAITKADADILVGSAHATARDGALRVIRLADEGHSGLTTALTHIYSTFTREATSPARENSGKQRRTPAEASKEWADLVSSATNLVTANPSDALTCDCYGQITGRIIAPATSPAEPPVTRGGALALDASLVPTKTEPTEEERKAGEQLAYEMLTQRARRAAKLQLDHEEQEQLFRPPPYRPSLVEELEIPDEPVRFLVADVFPLGANVLLTAGFKAGKTTLVGDLARCLADGEPFLDRYAVELTAGRVAIFNYEVDDNQYRRWLRELAVTSAHNISVLNLRGYRLPVTTPYVETWIVDWLTAHGIDTWIVDPFARAFTGCGNENDNSDVGQFLDTLDVIKERAGVRNLVLPTHTGRESFEEGRERARGATRLDDWTDVRWMLTKDQDGKRYFSATGRDVEVDEEMLTYTVECRRLSIGGLNRSGERTRNYVDLIVDVVAETPGLNSTQLRDAVRDSTPARQAEIDAARKQAVQAYRIVERPGAGKAKCYFPIGASGVAS